MSKKGIMDYQHDIFDRLENTTSSRQLYNARAVIGRLRQDSYQHFTEGSGQFQKWNEECVSLDKKLRKFSLPLELGGEDPIVLLNEFISQFEHAERRFRQTLDEVPVPQPYHKSKSFLTDFWLDALLRFTVSATLLEINKRKTMNKDVEKRFERIEKNLELAAQINQDTATLARESQERLNLLLAKMDEQGERMDRTLKREEQKEIAHTNVLRQPVA